MLPRGWPLSPSVLSSAGARVPRPDSWYSLAGWSKGLQLSWEGGVLGTLGICGGDLKLPSMMKMMMLMMMMRRTMMLPVHHLMSPVAAYLEISYRRTLTVTITNLFKTIPVVKYIINLLNRFEFGLTCILHRPQSKMYIVYAVEVWHHTSLHTRISSELVHALCAYTRLLRPLSI